MSVLTNKEYCDNHGNHCPSCKSADMDLSASYEIDGNEVNFYAVCHECNSTWQVQYTLSGYINLNEGN